MNTIAMDRNTLNGLFDNQKKLDELFDSIFDDESYFINGSTSLSQSANRHSTYEVENQFTYGRSNATQPLFAISNKPFYYLLPIMLEITAIYLVVTNLL